MSDIRHAHDESVARTAPNGPAGGAEARGIGGWLLIVAFGQVVGPLRLLAQLGQYYLDPENLGAFEQYPLAMYGELVMYLSLLLLVLITAVLFFRKSPYFPRLFIGELIALPALGILGTVWVALALSIQFGVTLRELLEIERRELVQLGLAVALALIWIPYTLRSRRVKNTFTAARATNMRDEGQGQVLLRAVVCWWAGRCRSGWPSGCFEGPTSPGSFWLSFSRSGWSASRASRSG